MQTLTQFKLHSLQQFIQQLQLKAYSASTIRTYRTEFLQLLKLLKSNPVNELTVGDIKRYMVYAMQQIGINEHTAHSRLNALKFYFEQVLGREKFFWEIPRPKKPLELPRIFNQDEIAAIINSIKNKKHKAMLMLAYSGGLRASEVVSIKTYDIDSKRMIIFIRQAKGKKDRVVSLSPVLLVMLREYALEYKPDKTGYLFEGITKGTHYSTRSLQEVLKAAKSKARIIKPGSVHSLRHSFVTHLIDKGTDVTMIQKLLGHNDLKTTLRYLHTSNKDLLKIISPLDDLKIT
jgi:site-specific recombinase XerD